MRGDNGSSMLRVMKEATLPASMLNEGVVFFDFVSASLLNGYHTDFLDPICACARFEKALADPKKQDELEKLAAIFKKKPEKVLFEIFKKTPFLGGGEAPKASGRGHFVGRPCFELAKDIFNKRIRKAEPMPLLVMIQNLVRIYDRSLNDEEMDQEMGDARLAFGADRASIRPAVEVLRALYKEIETLEQRLSVNSQVIARLRMSPDENKSKIEEFERKRADTLSVFDGFLTSQIQSHLHALKVMDEREMPRQAAATTDPKLNSARKASVL